MEAASPVLEPGELDVDAALKRMGGNTAIFTTIVQEFMRDAALVPSQLALQLTNAQSAQAVRTLHTLKGLAATVGALQLASVARDLETRAKVGIPSANQAEVVAQLQSSVDAAVLALTPVLKRLSSTTISQTGAELTAEQLRTRLTVLLDLLKNSNMQAVDVFDQMRQGQGPRWDELLIPLGEAIAHLDFAVALALCEAYLAQSKV